MKTIREVFSDNLKRLRGERTQDELAEAAGIPFRSYQQMESGSIPRESTGNLEAVAKALGVKEIDLFQVIHTPKDAEAQLNAKRLELIGLILSPDCDERALHTVLTTLRRLVDGRPATINKTKASSSS